MSMPGSARVIVFGQCLVDRFGLGETALQVDPQRPTGVVLVRERDGQHDFEILPDQAYDHIEARDWTGLAGCALSWHWETTLSRANAFAAAICGVRGAAPADLGFYEHWKSAWGLCV